MEEEMIVLSSDDDADMLHICSDGSSDEEAAIVLSSSDESSSDVKIKLDEQSGSEDDTSCKPKKMRRAAEPCIFDGNEKIPIFSRDGKALLGEDIIQILFETVADSSTMICSQQPLGCKETSSFVIDCSILQHPDDIRMDDLGSWKNSGVHSSYYNVLFSKDNIISLVEKMSGKPSVPRKSVYCLKRSYWKHKQDESFTRQLYELTDWNGKRYHLVYLQYRVKGPDGTPNIKPIPHGNSSRNESGYYRTKQSTKDLMKIKAQHMKPAEAYGELFEEQGGVFDCVSVGDVPRNRKQISNIRYKLSDPKPNKDTLHEVMKLCIEDESRADPFVRCVSAAPEASCMLATNEQLNDMVRFCTNSSYFFILGVDPTFNLGDFAVTVTTYRHLMLEYRGDNHHPVMVGPMFAHQRKEMRTYHTFASALIGLKPGLANLQCIGTDGEAALSNAFQVSFSKSKHILCFLHMRRNISFKLSEWANLFIKDIFGFQEGTHYVSGLVDSSSDVEFNENLLSLNDVWIEREIEARETRNPQFCEWFSRYHAKDMKTKMLRNFRHSLGIGDKEFTTNANESINAKIKETVNYKANELSIFCLKLKELVEEQRKDIERAFAMDCGPYRVKKEFKYLMKQPSEWVKMSRAAREKHINKINSASIIALQKPKPTSTAANIRESTDGINATNSCVDDQENMKPISLSPQECGLPSQIFSSIWKKASQLITKKGMIVDAPGCENVKVVASYTSAQPHFVRIFQNGKLTCDCQNNASLAVCSHTVAVADNEGCLTKLVEWYQKSKQTTNLWALSKKTKAPKKPGAKPHQASGKKKSVRLPVQSRHSLSFEQVKSTPAPLLPHNWCTTTPPPMIPYSPYPPPQLPPFPYPTASLRSPCSYQYPYSASYTPHTYYQPYGHQMTYQGSGFSGSSSSSVDIQHNSNSFVVVIRHGNISKCTSCNGVFERDQQLVVVKHVEKSFYTTEGEVHVSGERPHYYHASESCLMSMHPYFSGELLQIESETMDTLTTENKSIVKKLFEVSQLITVCGTD